MKSGNELFLNLSEINTARSCCNNILDKYRAIEREIFEVEKPFKPYLLEKLESLLQDANCIKSMCEEESE